MDYNQLAVELLEKMRALFKAKPHAQITEALSGEAFILQFIAISDGRVMPGDIGLETNVSSARVAAVLNNLEKKGLITRNIDKSDRRKIIVEITPDGRQYAENHLQGIIACVSKLLFLLGEDDAREYVRILGKVEGIMPQLWQDWQGSCFERNKL